MRTCIQLCTAVVALLPAVSLANGLMYQLPEDGAWAKYKMSMTVRTGDQEEQSIRGTLRLASVGKAFVDGEPCRWIQTDYEITFVEGDVESKTVLKVLVPEKHLGKGKTPLSHVVVTSQGVQATIHENGEQKRLDDPQGPHGSPLPLILGPPLAEPQTLKAAIIKNAKLGEIACPGEKGKIEVANDDRAKMIVEMENRLAKQSPFGVVSASWRGHVVEAGEGSSFEGTWDMHLVDFGQDTGRSASDKSAENPVQPATTMPRNGADAPATAGTEVMKSSPTTYEALAVRVMDSSAVEEAIDEFAAGLLKQRELVLAGERVLGSLVKSPEIAASSAAIVEKMAQSPALIQIRREHREGARAVSVKRMERALQGEAWKALNRTMEDALDKLGSRPLIASALISLLGAAEAAKFGDTMGNHFATRATDPKFMARFTELNAGKTSEPEALQELFLRHVRSEERWETFVLHSIRMQTLKKELVGALLAILESDKFKTIVTTCSAKILGDPQFQIQAVNVIDTMLRDDPTAAQIEGALSSLLALPVVEESITDALVAMQKSENLGTVFGKVWMSVMKSDEFKGVLDKAFFTDL